MKLRYQSLSGGRVLGEIEVQTSNGGKVAITAPGSDKAEALARVATIAQRIASDPVMMMLMPEAVADDLEELRMLAAAACHSPGAVVDAAEELGITVTGNTDTGHRARSKKRNPKYQLAHDLHAVAKSRDDGGDDDGYDDGGYDDGYAPPADNGYVPPYAAPPVAAPQPQKGFTRPAFKRLGDVVNGRGRSIDGFWDDVSNVASQAGSAAWQLAKDHRKEIAMGLATAAFGPGGGIAAGKAMDLIHAAQAGHPDAQKAVTQVAAKADAGDTKAKLMATVIKKELATQAAQEAAAPAPAAQPEHAEDPANDGHPDASNFPGAFNPLDQGA